MQRNGNIVRYTSDELDEMVRRGETYTDWARVDALTDADIAAAIDPDDEGDFDWSTLRAEGGDGSRGGIVELEADTLDWFRQTAPNDYADRINTILRNYVDAERRKAS